MNHLDMEDIFDQDFTFDEDFDFDIFPECELSPELEANMKTLFEQFDKDLAKKQRQKRANLTGRRMLGLVALVATIAAIVMTVAANKDTKQNYIVEIHDGYNRIDVLPVFVDEYEEFFSLTERTAVWYPYYLPEGYLLASLNDNLVNMEFEMMFENEQGDVIQFIQAADTTSRFHDTDTTVKREYTVGDDASAIIVEKRMGSATLCTVYWTDSVSSFMLETVVGVDETLKIAEHILWIEGE